ncbi:hypothetical protein BC940DRAFT_288771 [Gongronella butleri]|nr:hypothetical protein BC940DRAFT_288771 [Gongronella butleri]
MTTKDIVTAVDIVDAQQELEREAKEALPGKFEKCTFPMGYVRQPVFACRTCHGDDDLSKAAGMCYSCSMACHADHDLLELFPKRQFRCDCGLNGKFGGHPCSLTIPSKREAFNDKNKYNHNFIGKYCRCDQDYDPNKEEDVMYQCVLCEDWFHERCLGEIPDDVGDFDSFVCRACIVKHPCLIQRNRTMALGICTPDKPIHRWIGANATQPQQQPTNTNADQPDEAKEVLPESTKEQDGTKAAEVDEKNDKDKQPAAKSTKRSWDDAFDGCKSDAVKRDWQSDEQVEVFLQDGWRAQLCRCSNCLCKYRDGKIEFLLTEEATVEPEDDEDAGRSLLEIGMEQLVKMDRVQALDSIRLYHAFSDQIKSFLKSFQASGKVVTEDDINQFFDEKRRERKEAQHHHP